MEVSPIRDDAPGWQARLSLTLAERGGRTELVRRRHEGPLYVQRAFRPDGDDALHLYLLHPPGGLVGGDRLSIEVDAGAGSAALVTTPAAQKLYRSAGAEARQRVRLRVAAGARLEWFPSETIAFEGSLGRLDTVVELEPGASFAGWDIVCLGRPTRGERFDTGRLCSTLAIERGGPLLVERSLYEGGSAVLREPFGLGAEPVYGSLLWVPAEPDRAGGAAELLKSELGGFAVRNAVTAFDGVIAVRALGDRCEQIRKLFARAWALLRPRLHGTPACPPRIWST